jgi:hypothetical protein
MRYSVAAVCIGLVICAGTAQAATCLSASQVRSTDSPDGSALVLIMKNGAVWRAPFLRNCSGIRYSGFAWIVDGDRICENSQRLTVRATRATCTIGTLTQVKAAPSLPGR